MRRVMIGMCLGVALGGVTGLTGCDREVAHTKEVKVTDDSVKTKETRVTEGSDGSLHKSTTETKREVAP